MHSEYSVVDGICRLDDAVAAAAADGQQALGLTRSHEAKVCIAEGETLANPRRNRRFTPEHYLKTQAEMATLFADLPSTIENTARIAARCTVFRAPGLARGKTGFGLLLFGQSF